MRDFTYEDTDFSWGIHFGLRVPDIGSVQPTLNAVDKPELKPDAKPLTIESAASFSAWWSDANAALGLDVELLPVPGHPNAFEFSDQEFFPINGQLLANPEYPSLNNGEFTYEARFDFVYRGGEFFALSSDDDSWLFLNRGLAIDLGGLHSQGGRALRVDTVAVALGLEIGKTYPAHLFFAERMPSGSELVVRTDLIAPDACE